jgi:beta-N-acetylhexosaminidase
MTSHIVNKSLDKSGLPGTLSKEILDGILRKKLGYTGVVFSDDMQMKAIANNFGLEETIRLAINAGVDIMCFSNNIAGIDQRTVDKVHAIIKGFVSSGQISSTRIDESFKRIMKLKSRLNVETVSNYQSEIAKLQSDLNKANAALATATKQIAPVEENTKKSKKKKKTKS